MKYICEQMMSERSHLCFTMCICGHVTYQNVHVHGSILNGLCSICLSEKTNVKKRQRVIGDSFTTALGVYSNNNNSRKSLFCNSCMTLEIGMSISHLSLLTHFNSPMHPILSFLLFL